MFPISIYSIVYHMSFHAIATWFSQHQYLSTWYDPIPCQEDKYSVIPNDLILGIANHRFDFTQWIKLRSKTYSVLEVPLVRDFTVFLVIAIYKTCHVFFLAWKCDTPYMLLPGIPSCFCSTQSCTLFRWPQSSDNCASDEYRVRQSSRNVGSHW